MGVKGREEWGGGVIVKMKAKYSIDATWIVHCRDLKIVEVLKHSHYNPRSLHF